MLQIWTSMAKEKYIYRLYPKGVVVHLSPERLEHAVGTIGTRFDGPVGRLLYLRLSVPSNYTAQLA
jgi:hypothetical protein